MTAPLRVLLVEDSPADAELVMREVRRGRPAVVFERVEDAASMRAALARQAWDIVLSDWSLPKFSGLEALAIVGESGLDLPFILISGTVGEELAVEAMRAGAHDFVLKDRLSRLAPLIERELREHALRRAHQASEDQLRRTEQQLRQAQKMDAVGRLAGGIAHDFNNLLSVILSYSAMVAGDLPPGDEMRADVEQIGEAGRRAAELTRQLLLFSRQEVTETHVLDLNELVSGMKKMLPRLLRADIELAFALHPSLGRVRVNPGHIEQVVMNLAINARDAMPTGGQLTIETANVVLSNEYAGEHLGCVPGAYVLLAMIDTGVGMDAATQARIFEPYFTTKEVGRGTGLGLSTVFGIVKQCGGSVLVYSEVGKGATFKVYLPLVDSPVDSIRMSVVPGTLRGTETILLVEDDEHVRTVAAGILRRHQYHVLEARNGAEALTHCEGTPEAVHLLITDVVMPGMSGPDLAKRIAKTRPSLKVLCMSGYTDDAVVRHGALQAGIPFLQKPFTPLTLATKVRAVLDDG